MGRGGKSGVIQSSPGGGRIRGGGLRRSWGFGDGGARRRWTPVWGQCGGEGVGDVFGDVFGGGVELVEGWGFVEVGVVEGGDDLVEVGFEFVEVEEEAVGVEGWAFNGDGDAPVVAVEGFAGAAAW